MNVFILTEGGLNIGFGHITRCIALYDAFCERGIIPEFIINGDESVMEFIRLINGYRFNWIENNQELFNKIDHNSIVIIDSYLADLSFYQSISKFVKLTVYLDDDNRVDYPRGVIINSSINSENFNYTKNENTEYLLGNKYIMLRKEFWNTEPKKIGNIKSIMLTFGGDDSKNITPKILNFLNETYPDLIKKIIIGKAYKNIKEIESLKTKFVETYYYPDANLIKNIMYESDLAISASGQTLYELARVGTPILSIAVAKNQINHAIQLEKIGIIDFVGSSDDLNIISLLHNKLEKINKEDIRYEKSMLGISLVDGNGARRIIKLIINKL